MAWCGLVRIKAERMVPMAARRITRNVGDVRSPPRRASDAFAGKTPAQKRRFVPASMGVTCVDQVVGWLLWHLEASPPPHHRFALARSHQPQQHEIASHLADRLSAYQSDVPETVSGASRRRSRASSQARGSASAATSNDRNSPPTVTSWKSRSASA